MRRMDIDLDGKVMYADFSEYIKPRVEWQEAEVDKRRHSPRSPRWNAKEKEMMSLAEIEERKSPSRGDKNNNTEIRIY